jgi:hypothetical protein
VGGILLRRIAAAQNAPAQSPDLLRPGRNEYSSNCTIPDEPAGNK